jgi:2-iminobutanoate/2-iminopropanoate deaminase
MKKSMLFATLLIAMAGMAQTEAPVVRFVNPASVSTPKGYTQVVQVDLGNCRMLIISGQVAFDKQGNLVGKDDFSSQANQVFVNLKNIIEEQGGTMNDLVKIGIYLTDVAQLPAFREVRNKFINLSQPPASTLVQVNKLFRDDVLLEVEATAVIPKRNQGSPRGAE